MRRLVLATLAAGAVAFLGYASTSACDRDKAAAAGTKSCCAKKGEATTASTNPAAARDVVPAVMSEGSGKASGADCPMAKAAAKSKGAGCPMQAAAEGGTTASTRCAKGDSVAEVKQSGRVLCARCELKQSDSCLTVFQARGEQAYTPLCGEGMTQDLMKITRHGELEVTIQGHLKKAENGAGNVLCVEGFSVGSI